MTPEQIDHVQTSFRIILPIRVQAAELFYGRLFATDPSVRSIFAQTDFEVQGDKLMAASGFVVDALRKPDTILVTVHALARRHVQYGVAASHFASVGEALLWTVRLGLGDAATPEVLAAWAAAYALLSEAMLGSLEADPRPTDA